MRDHEEPTIKIMDRPHRSFEECPLCLRSESQGPPPPIGAPAIIAKGKSQAEEADDPENKRGQKHLKPVTYPKRKSPEKP